MVNDVIKARELSFRYRGGENLVLNKINLNIREGEIFGLLGPNGAGKTTLISIFSTILKPTYGKVIVNNANVVEDPDSVRKNIGVLFQKTILDEELSGYHNLEFYARLYDIPDRKKRIDNVVKLMRLESFIYKKVEEYSEGMKRQLEIARCLLHKPKILIFDEPTIGLDPIARRKVWNYLKKLNKEEKVTIIIATHYTEEADFLCDRIAIINQGRITLIGAPNKIKSESNFHFIKMRVSNKAKVIIDYLGKKKWVKNLSYRGGYIKFKLYDPKKNLKEFLGIINDYKSYIGSLELNMLSLDDAFINHVNGMKEAK